MQAGKRGFVWLAGALLVFALVGCNGNKKKEKETLTGAQDERVVQGLSQLEQNQFEAAVQSFSAAIAADPQNAAAYEGRAIAYMRRGKFDPAMADMKASMDIQPTADGYFNLGNILVLQGFYLRAVAAYEMSLSLSPNDPEVLSNMGSALMFSERSGEARGVLERALSLRPNDPEVHTTLGMYFHLVERDYDGAKRHYLKAIELDPKYWEAHFNLARAYEQLGDGKGAQRAWEGYLRARPDAPDRIKIESRLGYEVSPES